MKQHHADYCDYPDCNCTENYEPVSDEDEIQDAAKS